MVAEAAEMQQRLETSTVEVQVLQDKLKETTEALDKEQVGMLGWA